MRIVSYTVINLTCQCTCIHAAVTPKRDPVRHSSPQSPAPPPHSPSGWLWTASAGGTPCFLVLQSSDGDVAQCHPRGPMLLGPAHQKFAREWRRRKEGVLSVEMLQSVTQDSQTLHFVSNGFVDAVNTAKGGSQEGGKIRISHLEIGG